MSTSPSPSAHQAWEAILGQLLLRVTRQNYDNWLRNTAGLRFEGNTLVVAAANELAADWLSTRMRSVIAQAIAAAGNATLQVRFEPAGTPECGDPNAALQPSLVPASAAALNPRFTFDTYLAGEFNRLALSAAQDLARDSHSSYSPLFITGVNGMGKTHLLHALAHAAAPSCRLLLVNAEQFLSEFTSAMRNRSPAAFRARYRETDFLIVDDVHLLSGKKATLNEFCQTLCNLHDQGKRIAVAGDLSGLEGELARFSSQLAWGLVAPIAQPAVEDRIRFVKVKAAHQGIQLPEEVEHYLALRVKSSIRDLEGAVNRVAAIARISREPVDIDFAARALRAIATSLPATPSTPTPAQVVSAVCQHLNLGPAELVSSKRNRELSYGRHIAMFLLRQDAGLTFAAIARLLNKKDHSTVVHACTQLQKQLPLSPSLRADIDAIRSTFHTRSTAA